MDTDGPRRTPAPLARSLTAACALALLASTLSALPAAAAPDCTATVRGDVNGDGFADVAVGEPGNNRAAGAVHLFYGSADGLQIDAVGATPNDQYVTQDSPGVPGAAEADDAFGSSTVLGDFDGNGCADLAVGSSGENGFRGSLTVLYGSPTGLTTTGAQSWTENTLLGAGSALRSEFFGETLASGDLDGDGIDDLAVGAPSEQTGARFGGGVVVLLGAAGGLGTRAGTTRLLTQASPGVPGDPEDGDGFGAALAIGDFNGNGVGDLAVGALGENQVAGVVDVLPGAPGVGVGTLAGTAFDQNTPGVPGSAEPLDRFGGALAAGDVTGDGRDDLVIGAPGENGVDPEPGFGAGSVTFLRGSATGLTTSGSQVWSQDSPGVGGVADDADEFGFSLALGRFDGGAGLDLAIGAPRDAVGRVGEAGTVTLLLGGAGGLTTAGVGGTRYHQDVAGLAGTAEPEDAFGWSVAATAVQNPGIDNLVVGVPGETAVRSRDGEIQQLATNEFGPSTAGSRTLHQDIPGVQGVAAADDNFGWTVG